MQIHLNTLNPFKGLSDLFCFVDSGDTAPSKFLPPGQADFLSVGACDDPQDAQSCGGCCRGGPVSHRGGQVISCSERPPSLTAVSAVRSPPPTSVTPLLLLLFSKM